MVEAFAVIDANTPSFQDAMDRESVSRLHQFSPIALSNLFRGVVLNTARAVSENRCSERDWPILSAIGTHIAMRVGELQRNELEHVEHSLQRLGPNVCESVLSWLQQTIAKELDYRFGNVAPTQTQEGQVDDLRFPGLSCFDALGLDNVEGDQQTRSDDGADELFGCGQEFDTAGHAESTPNIGKGGGKGKQRRFNGEDEMTQGSVNAPPGLAPSARQRRGQGRRNQAPNAGNGLFANEEPWSQFGKGRDNMYGMYGEQQQHGSGFTSGQYSNHWEGPALTPGLQSAHAPPWNSESYWTPGRHSSGYVAVDSTSNELPWPAMAGNMRNPSAVAFEQTRPSYNEPNTGKGAQLWKPCTVDVSCLVQPAQDPARSHEWQVVDLCEYIYASLIGTGSSVIRLRFGVVDERVVVKRLTDNTCSWPVNVANSAHVLAPRALIAAADGRDHYAAYTYCQHGSFAEWIMARSTPKQTLTNPEIAYVMLGIAEVASLFVSCGVDVSAFRADEIFVDGQGQPKVRLHHDASARSLPLTSAAKWFSPEEAEVFSPQFPNYSAWPAAAYRLGLLLHCLCAGITDPYPDKHVDLVILDLRREKLGSNMPVRPAQRKDGPLHVLTMSCLASNPNDRPGYEELKKTLSSICRGNA